MLWSVTCVDVENSADRRAENREGHFEHLRANRDAIVMCGPLMNEDRTAPIGSLLVVDFEDRAAVEAFAAADPYKKGGVFKSVVIYPYKSIQI